MGEARVTKTLHSQAVIAEVGYGGLELALPLVALRGWHQSNWEATAQEAD